MYRQAYCLPQFKLYLAKVIEVGRVTTTMCVELNTIERQLIGSRLEYVVQNAMIISDDIQ